MRIGDKVICIRTRTTPKGYSGAIKGKIYTVLGIFNCPCGNFAIDVGIETPYGVIMRAPCTACGSKHLWPKRWYMNKRDFVPIDWDDCTEVLIYEVLNPIEEKLITLDKIKLS